MKYTILLIILLMFLAACMPAEQPQVEVVEEVEEVVEEPEEPIQEVVEEVEPEVEESEEEAEPEEEDEKLTELDKNQQKLADLKKKVGELDTYRYTYRADPDFTRPIEVNIKDNRMRLRLSSTSKYDRANYFDTVYLDLGSKEAVAYCEDKHFTCEDANRKFEVGYEDYIITSPVDWAKLIPLDATFIESQSFTGRTGLGYEFDLDDITHRVWIDEFYGVALQVIEKPETDDKIKREFLFEGTDVSEEDVYHQEAGLN